MIGAFFLTKSLKSLTLINNYLYDFPAGVHFTELQVESIGTGNIYTITVYVPNTFHIKISRSTRNCTIHFKCLIQGIRSADIINTFCKGVNNTCPVECITGRFIHFAGLAQIGRDPGFILFYNGDRKTIYQTFQLIFIPRL